MSGTIIAGSGGLHADSVVIIGSNTSATGGPLPQINAPISKAALEDAFSATVAGILRLSNGLVRPRWQPGPPNQPDAGVDWVSLGITARDTNGFPYVSHAHGGPSTLIRWPILTVLISLYGPNADDYAEELRDALYLNQNLEALNLLGVKLVEAGEVVAVPDLTNVQWINRVDLRTRFAMEQTRQYNILDFASSDGTVTTDTGVSGSFLAINPT